MSLGNLHEVFKTIDTLDFDENFVGLYVELDAVGDCEHIGVIIKCWENSMLFHFKFSGVRLEPVPSMDELQCYTTLKLYLGDKEIEEFYGYCHFLRKKISNNNSRFSYIFDDSKFSMDVKRMLDNSPTDMLLTTCTGFCLKVLDGNMLENRYLNTTDWDNTTLDDNRIAQTIKEIKKIFEERGFDYSLINEGDIKRIYPIELMTSSLFVNYPIRKYQIDSQVDEVRECLSNISK